MFEIAIDLMIQFSELIPYIIPLILLINIVRNLVFGEG